MKIMAQTFLNFENSCDLTDVQASMYDTKPRPDLLTLFTTFYDLSVSCNLFPKAEMHQFRAGGRQRI